MQVAKDTEFLYGHGIEMLIEISRFWHLEVIGLQKVNLAFGVMGPDEFQMMVNHNTYTNYMAKRTFDYTVEVLKKLKTSDETRYSTLLSAHGLSEKEIGYWQICSKEMLILKRSMVCLNNMMVFQIASCGYPLDSRRRVPAL